MTASRLLVVDDDSDFAVSLAEFLELCDHRVDISFTGKDGIEAARHNNYDAVLMDISLPGLNGVESLRQIKQFNPTVRCFLMTGFSADHIAEQGIEAGAVEILTKPIELEEVLRRLSNIETRN
jgi:two-component system OmpR family response regulator/two-component system response regulator QseB